MYCKDRLSLKITKRIFQRGYYPVTVTYKFCHLTEAMSNNGYFIIFRFRGLYTLLYSLNRLHIQYAVTIRRQYERRTGNTQNQYIDDEHFRIVASKNQDIKCVIMTLTYFTKIILACRLKFLKLEISLFPA